MNTAFYIKSLPHSHIKINEYDQQTGEPTGKFIEKKTDFRTFVYTAEDMVVPLDTRYKAKVYKETDNGRLMKLVGRNPSRLKPMGFTNKEDYDGAKNTQIATYYQSLFIHNPNVAHRYKFDRPLKIMYFDIETITLGDGKFPDPLDPKGRYPICMIGYQINDEETQVLEFNLEAYVANSVDSDLEIIGAFLDVIRRENPDVIVGYNSYEFDIPYIGARCSTIDKAREGKMRGNTWNALLDTLIRKPAESNEEQKTLRSYVGERILYLDRRNPNRRVTRPDDPDDLCGRLHYDIYNVDVVMDQKLSGIKDKKMKTLAKHHKIIDVIEVGDDIGNTLDLYINNHDKLYDYQKSDVMITHALCDKYFPLNITLAEMLQVPLSMIIEKGRGTVANTFMFQEEIKNNMVPMEGNDDRRRHEALYHLGRTYQGAIVGIMKKGIMITKKEEDAHIYLKQSWKEDFISMYPSSVVQFNLGPDTTRVIYDYEDEDWFGNFSNPSDTHPIKTLERVIPPMWESPTTGERCAVDACPTVELWNEYDQWLKINDEDEHARKFSTRFYHFRDTVGLKYLDIYLPDSRLNAIIHLRVCMDKEGFLKKRIIELFATRNKFKALMKNPDATPAEKSGYDSAQNAVKVIMNSLYGIAGNERSTADIALALAITGLCRYCTTAVVQYINENYNNAVAEIDTDGLIVKEDVDEEKVNDFLCEKIKQDTGMELGKHMLLEKEVFDRMYIYRMKNYILLDKDGTKIKHGVTMKASSHHAMYDECIEDVSDFVLSDIFLPKEDIDANREENADILSSYNKRLNELIQKYTEELWSRPIEDFAKKAKLSMSPDHYLKTSPGSMHSQLIRLTQAKNIDVTKDSTLRYLHCKRGDRKYDLYIAGDDEHNKDLSSFLDRERYLVDVTKIFARFNIDIGTNKEVNFI